MRDGISAGGMMEYKVVRDKRCIECESWWCEMMTWHNHKQTRTCYTSKSPSSYDTVGMECFIVRFRILWWGRAKNLANIVLICVILKMGKKLERLVVIRNLAVVWRSSYFSWHPDEMWVGAGLIPGCDLNWLLRLWTTSFACAIWHYDGEMKHWYPVFTYFVNLGNMSPVPGSLARVLKN